MAEKETIETEVIEEEVVETAPVAKKNSDKPAEKKPGFFKRTMERLKKFWKSYKSELKKITWYSRKQTFTSTLLVLVCMGVSAVFIGLLDLGFSKGIEGLGMLVEFIKR